MWYMHVLDFYEKCICVPEKMQLIYKCCPEKHMQGYHKRILYMNSMYWLMSAVISFLFFVFEKQI